MTECVKNQQTKSNFFPTRLEMPKKMGLNCLKATEPLQGDFLPVSPQEFLVLVTAQTGI